MMVNKGESGFSQQTVGLEKKIKSSSTLLDLMKTDILTTPIFILSSPFFVSIEACRAERRLCSFLCTGHHAPRLLCIVSSLSTLSL